MTFDWKKILKKIKTLNPADMAMDIYDKLEQAGIIGWPVKATALSYYCILGVVPFLALCFVMAEYFGLQVPLTDAIISFIRQYDEGGNADSLGTALILMLQTFADNLIKNYRGSVMAFVALIVIFWSAYRILVLLESIFGDIFGYHPPRRVIHRVMDYFTVMVIVPLVLMAAIAINVYLTQDTDSIPLGVGSSVLFTTVSPYIIIISPYIILWMVLSWVYAYFSRGLIRWPERMLGGFLTGCAFLTFQTFYVRIMVALTSYSAIYGSFAAIPLLMIWLYISWVIVLVGGELTRRLSDLFATGKHFFSLVTPPTWRSTFELSCKVLKEVIKNYESEPAGGATSLRQLSRSTGAPLPALGGVITRLISVDLLVRISGPTADEGPSFLPARSPDQLTPDYIREALEAGPIDLY